MIVMASRFKLREWRDVPPFFLAALKIRQQMLRSPGIIGVSLIAKPIAKTFYTLSAWEDRSSLNAAVSRQPHLTTMERFRSRTEGSLFAFWSAAVRDPHPGWDEALQRLDEQARNAPLGRDKASDGAKWQGLAPESS
jgi:hypothetical protein